MRNTIFILLFIPFIAASNLIYSQQYSLKEHPEFKVSIAGEVNYDSFFKDGDLIYEKLSNDDLDLDVTVYSKDDGYEYFGALEGFTKEMIDALGYTNSRFFDNQSTLKVKRRFLITYSQEWGCYIVFGVIQDRSAQKQYEIELFCYNISTDEARSIIKSIEID